jgi:hypothetical protein
MPGFFSEFIGQFEKVGRRMKQIPPLFDLEKS